MANHDDARLCGLKPDLQQDVAGISAVELGTANALLWDGVRLFGEQRIDELRDYLAKARESQAESAYDLSLGLIRLDGNQDEFETLAIEYAVNVGKSPPNWLEAHTRKPKSLEDVVSIAVQSLTQDTIIETTVSMESPWPCVIDLAQVTKTEAIGLELYNDCLNQRINRGDKTKLVNGEILVSSFLDNMRAGDVKQHAPYWTFCFTYFKLCGEEPRFNTLMSEFVAKGGKALPWQDCSWVDERSNETKVEGWFTAGTSLADVNAGFADRLVREGLVSTAIKDHHPIRVDFTSVKAGHLLDLGHVHSFVKRLLQEKVEIHFANVNEIHQAMLRMMGVDRWVKITTAGAVL